MARQVDAARGSPSMALIGQRRDIIDEPATGGRHVNARIAIVGQMAAQKLNLVLNRN